MVNRIDSRPVVPSQQQQTSRVSTEHGGGSNAGQTSRGGADSVGGLMGSAIDLARKAPDMDMSKVEAIKQSIQSGDYPLDAEKIAEAFLKLESDLVG